MTSNKNKNWRNLFGSSSPHKRKKLGGTIFSALMALVLVGFLSVAAFFAVAKFTTAKILTKDMAPMASSQFFDAKGNLITTVNSEEDRIPVTIDKVPKNLQHAFLAAEDIRFYEHGGIDFRGIGRAIYTYIRWGEVQGGSTITQQFVKNVFLSHEQSLERKIEEAILSLMLEDNYTKDEILELYLNTTYFGAGANGIKQAANKYFGKAPSALSLAEAAVIAALPYAPSALNPLENPLECKKRQQLVLAAMHKYGMINQAQLAEAKAEVIRLNNGVKM